MNRPEKRNAFNNALYRDLRDALADAQENEHVRVVVLTGAGKGFLGRARGDERCTTTDGAPHGFRPSSIDGGLRQALIAAVNGVGTGLGLTCCSTVTSSTSPSTRLRCPFVTLGVAGAASQISCRSSSASARPSCSTRRNGSMRATPSSSVLRRAFPTPAPTGRIGEASEIAGHPPDAMRHTKRLLRYARCAVRAARARGRPPSALARPRT